jgi:hypothetical protein
MFLKGSCFVLIVEVLEMERIGTTSKIDRSAITHKNFSRMTPDYDLDGDEEIEY